MNHTPGPWKLKLGKGIEYDYQIYDTANNMVVAFPHYDMLRTKKQSKANAKLMAAAPELLQALKCLLEMGHAKAGDLARTAIAKAEGLK